MLQRWNALVGRIKKKRYNSKRSPLHIGKTQPFIFIHINKTGGVSIATALGMIEAKHYKRHYTAQEAIERIGKKTWDTTFKFTVVRNPYDKVYSQYKFRVTTNQNNLSKNLISFREWVSYTYGQEKHPFYYDKPRMFLPQVEWLKDTSGRISYDYILRFECIRSDFQQVAKALGFDVQLPYLNATEGSDYRSLYDQETKDTIQDWFQDDLDYFGYQF